MSQKPDKTDKNSEPEELANELHIMSNKIIERKKELADLTKKFKALQSDLITMMEARDVDNVDLEGGKSVEKKWKCHLEMN